MLKACPNCGTDLRESYRFCHQCGADVEQVTDPNVDEEADEELRKTEFWMNMGCIIFVGCALTLIIGALFFSYK